MLGADAWKPTRGTSMALARIEMTAETSVTHAQYLHQAQFALFGCQMVEESLKSFLMYARDVNKLCPTEYAAISKSDEELDEMPLGPLIKLVKSAIPQSPLLARLEQLRPERNHCAHRALALCFISDVSDKVSLPDEYRRLCAIRELAWSCFEETKPFLAAAEKRRSTLHSGKHG